MAVLMASSGLFLDVKSWLEMVVVTAMSWILLVVVKRSSAMSAFDWAWLMRPLRESGVMVLRIGELSRVTIRLLSFLPCAPGFV